MSNIGLAISPLTSEYIYKNKRITNIHGDVYNKTVAIYYTVHDVEQTFCYYREDIHNVDSSTVISDIIYDIEWRMENAGE